jgi:YaiO family outer membrane protein
VPVSPPPLVGIDRPPAAFHCAALATPHRVDFTASTSTLTNGYPDWSSLSLSFGNRTGCTTRLASIEYAKRFGSSDAYGEVGWSRRLSQTMAINGFVGATADADFLPHIALRLEVEQRMGAFGWAVQGRGLHYEAENIGVFEPRFTYFFGKQDSFIRLKLPVAVSQDSISSGIGVGVEFNSEHGGTWRAQWSNAPETSAGTVLRVETLGAGIGWPLSETRSIRLDALHEDRGNFSRRELSVALTSAF